MAACPIGCFTSSFCGFKKGRVFAFKPSLKNIFQSRAQPLHDRQEKGMKTKPNKGIWRYRMKRKEASRRCQGGNSAQYSSPVPKWPEKLSASYHQVRKQRQKSLYRSSSPQNKSTWLKSFYLQTKPPQQFHTNAKDCHLIN